MIIENVFFTAQGCRLDLDGVACELDSKLSFLRAGGSYVRALDPQQQPLADRAISGHIGGDGWEQRACTEPRVVALDIQCYAWRDASSNAPWHDSPQPVPSAAEAMRFVSEWLAHGKTPGPATHLLQFLIAYDAARITWNIRPCEIIPRGMRFSDLRESGGPGLWGAISHLHDVSGGKAFQVLITGRGTDITLQCPARDPGDLRLIR